MGRCIEIGKLIEALRGTDQSARLVHHTTIAHPDEADCTRGAGLIVGRLELDGREVEAHRAETGVRTLATHASHAGSV